MYRTSLNWLNSALSRFFQNMIGSLVDMTDYYIQHTHVNLNILCWMKFDGAEINRCIYRTIDVSLQSIRASLCLMSPKHALTAPSLTGDRKVGSLLLFRLKSLNRFLMKSEC